MVKMQKLSGRAEWLEARKGHIGGSDASSIVGMNPYKSNVDLWEEMTGRREPEDISENPFVSYGHAAEEPLRRLFALDFPEYTVEYVENNMFTNDDLPFAHASLDGWMHDRDGRLGVLEIKTTTVSGAAQAERWRNRIPDNYYIQVLHYMMTVEAEFAILKAQMKRVFDDSEVVLTTKHYMIEADDVREDMEYLKNAERQFYEAVLEDRRPSLVLPPI